MNVGQFLLLKLMEECAEISQRASKQIQFGKTESQNGQGLTNAERLKQELLDLASITRLLHENKELPEVEEEELEVAYEKKRVKMQKYLDLSHELGQLPKITL